jgi:hypothetical protein
MAELPSAAMHLAEAIAALQAEMEKFAFGSSQGEKAISHDSTVGP